MLIEALPGSIHKCSTNIRFLVGQNSNIVVYGTPDSTLVVGIED